MQDRELLPESEIFGGQVSAASDDASNENKDELHYSHFTGLMGY